MEYNHVNSSEISIIIELKILMCQSFSQNSKIGVFPCNISISNDYVPYILIFTGCVTAQWDIFFGCIDFNAFSMLSRSALILDSSPTNSCTQVRGWNDLAGQQVLHQRWAWVMHCAYVTGHSSKWIHSGFETQSRCYQKFKTVVSTAHKKIKTRKVHQLY